MTYEGCSWNVGLIGEEISNGLTKEQFIERCLREGQYKKYGPEDRQRLLEIVYDRIKKEYGAV